MEEQRIRFREDQCYTARPIARSQSIKTETVFILAFGTMPEPPVCGRLIQWISKVAGLAFGAGIIWKVEEAYTYLTSVWRPGDSNLAIRI